MPIDDDDRRPPLACSLGDAELRERLNAIAGLNAEALRSRHLGGLALELSYDMRARSDVLQMVERERQCCAFLRFDLRDADDAVHVTITVPDSAADAARAILAQLAATTTSLQQRR